LPFGAALMAAKAKSSGGDSVAGCHNLAWIIEMG
jgi:hypothetical protein